MNETHETWQVSVNGQIYETDFDGLISWIHEGALLPQDKVRRGNLRWLEAGKIPALYGVFNAKDSGAVNSPVVTTSSGEPSPSAPTPPSAMATENQTPSYSPSPVYPAPQNFEQNPFEQPPPPPQFSARSPDLSTNYQQPGDYQTPNFPLRGAPSAQASPVYTEVPDLVKSGANWYFWIAGLSLVNSLIIAFGGQLSFITGLAATQVVDGLFEIIALESGSSAAYAFGFVINLVITGVFVLFGIFGRRGAGWAFLVGMILYAIDGAIYLLVGSFLGVVVHGIALFYLYRGWQACD